MKWVQSKFKFNNYNREEPDIYLGMELSKMDNDHREKCWYMSSEKYCTTVVNIFIQHWIRKA